MKKSFAFISNGNANKGFNHENVHEFMPKLLMTHILDLMREDRHTSIVAIRRLFNFLRVFVYLADQEPKIYDQINAELQTFIEKPDKRHKDYTPNLGNILVFSILSNKYSYNDIMSIYLTE
jgi:hypothetical protein